jgi:hypothetical protein
MIRQGRRFGTLQDLHYGLAICDGKYSSRSRRPLGDNPQRFASACLSGEMPANRRVARTCWTLPSAACAPNVHEEWSDRRCDFGRRGRHFSPCTLTTRRGNGEGGTLRPATESCLPKPLRNTLQYTITGKNRAILNDFDQPAHDPRIIRTGLNRCWLCTKCAPPVHRASEFLGRSCIDYVPRVRLRSRHSESRFSFRSQTQFAGPSR